MQQRNKPRRPRVNPATSATVQHAPYIMRYISLSGMPFRITQCVKLELAKCMNLLSKLIS